MPYTQLQFDNFIRMMEKIGQVLFKGFIYFFRG